MPTAEIRGTHLCNAYEVTRMNDMIAAGQLEVTEPTMVPWEGLPAAHQAMWENRHTGATYVVNHALPEAGVCGGKTRCSKRGRRAKRRASSMATKVKASDPETADAAVRALARPGRLAGKVALVTGAAGNLGGEIARHCLSEGATVVFTGRTAERTENAMTLALAETGADAAQASVVVMDGADAASCRAGIADIIARHGRIDILVNNAGSAGPKQPARAPAPDRYRPGPAPAQRRYRYRDRRRCGPEHPCRRVEHGARRRPGDGRGGIDH